MFYSLPTEIPMRLYEPREEYRYLRLVSLIIDTLENIETSLIFGQRFDHFCLRVKKGPCFFLVERIVSRKKPKLTIRKKIVSGEFMKMKSALRIK